ncbi:hypothetical protein [Bradyrhizobium yuanmingense]|uniref:hypothetical protein n=1 Tax=Bradyrhizobium yuanmingense TaxID=108015 RepID=UPI0031BA63A5
MPALPASLLARDENVIALPLGGACRLSPATLIESHERHAKEKAGLSGRRRGQKAAALDAAGAGLGSIGLAAFAAIFHLVVGQASRSLFSPR